MLSKTPDPPSIHILETDSIPGTIIIVNTKIAYKIVLTLASIRKSLSLVLPSL